MFSAFNTFGRMGAPAGRTLAQQIAAMSPSLWLEPSVTNGYQDSAGTTALTQPGAGAADPPVGLALDLSQGAALGPELNTNPGPFSNTTGYIGDGATLTVSGGILTANRASNTSIIFDYYSGQAGKSYIATIVVTNVSGASALVSAAPAAGWAGIFIGQSTIPAGGSGTFRIQVTSLAGQFRFRVHSEVGTSISISSFSVREIKGNHAIQATSTARPKLSARVNLLVGTATLATQSVTVTAAAHTIDWSGAGTITASGAYSGALSKGQTFTPTAGSLTLTVAGSVTSASLVLGSSAGTYQAVTDANTYDTAGFPLIHQFDGVDDVLNVTFPSSLGSDCTVVTANRGTTPTILTGQTIGTSYTITATNAGRLVFPRALTAAETAIVTKWATQKGALP